MQAKEDYLAEELNRFETQVRAKNVAMTRSVDDNIGKVLATLDELGLRENTLVVFANDNGGAMPYNGSLNAPLRGAKGTALEGGNRVPYLMSWPGVIPEGTLFVDPVSTLDIVPTFLSAAGGALPGDRSYDGADLIPHLTGLDMTAPHDTLFWKMQWGCRGSNRRLEISPYAVAGNVAYSICRMISRSQLMSLHSTLKSLIDLPNHLNIGSQRILIQSGKLIKRGMPAHWNATTQDVVDSYVRKLEGHLAKVAPYKKGGFLSKTALWCV